MNNRELMQKRLMVHGGLEQENRMIQRKLETLEKALYYSYQACTVLKLQSFSSCLNNESGIYEPMRALINSDKVKQDYDDKIISIPYFYNKSGKPFVNNREGCYETLRPGDVFEWCKTNTQWIVYLREISEDAYFRGEIRRCRYTINFKDENGNTWSTYAAIRGPVETQIDSIQKNQVRVDRPNLSLNILLPKNEITLSAFDRYSEFLFAGKCWRVEAPDSISMENIIEINAEEYYINRENDDVDNQIKDGLVIKPVIEKNEIAGAASIRPLIPEAFSIERDGGSWSIKEKCLPVTLDQSGNSAIVTWNKSTAKDKYFTLVWKKDNQIVEKRIYVESLL